MKAPGGSRRRTGLRSTSGLSSSRTSTIPAICSDSIRTYRRHRASVRQGAPYMDLIKIVILICSVEMAPQDCQTDSAMVVIAGPTVTTMMACSQDGQAHIARTSLLDEHTYPKLLCTHARSTRARFDSEWKAAPVGATGHFGAR